MGSYFEEHKYAYTIPMDKIRRLTYEVERLRAEHQQKSNEVQPLELEVERLREMLGKKIGQDFDSIDAMSARLHRIEEAVREVIDLMTSPAVSRRSLRLAARLRATLEEKP